jgi:hypothetical protein
VKIVYNFDLEVTDFSQGDFVVSERNSILQATALHNGNTKTRLKGIGVPQLLTPKGSLWMHWSGETAESPPEIPLFHKIKYL